MDAGHFYFLTDEYFDKFGDTKLMSNKEEIDGQIHDRPCFFAFIDRKTSLYWMIPISSQVAKFSAIHKEKIKKYKRCDTIVFGKVLGSDKAFLIQNMCPVSIEYIKNQYIDGATSVAVTLSQELIKELRQKATKVLLLSRKGFNNLIFPDVLEIERQLLC